MNILPRSFGIGGHRYFSLNASIGFSLSQENLLYSTSDLLKALSPIADSLNMLGDGLPVGRGEWLLAGCAYAPGQMPSKQWAVSVEVGESKKTLNVYADRIFYSTGIEATKTVLKVPLIWEGAWGGPTIQENFLGCGMRNSDGVVIVPTVEDPKFPWKSPDAQLKPGALLPLGLMHPLREKYAGTYQENYLEQDFPGFPKDCTWQYFNTALSDQQIASYWKGDEIFKLWNLHPEHANISGALPALRPRIWMSKKNCELEEVSLDLGRVWFLPEAMIGVLNFQGVIDSSSLDGGEIEKILGAVEAMNEPSIAKSHYESVFNERMERNTKGALALLDDSQLCSEKYEICFSSLDKIFQDSGDKSAQFNDTQRERQIKAMQEDITLEAEKYEINDADSKKSMDDLRSKMAESWSASKDEPKPQFKNISDLSKYIEKKREELNRRVNIDPQLKSAIDRAKESLRSQQVFISEQAPQSAQIKNHLENIFDANSKQSGIEGLEKLISMPSPVGREEQWIEIKKNIEQLMKFLQDSPEVNAAKIQLKNQAENIQKAFEEYSSPSLFQNLIDQLDGLESNDIDRESDKSFQPLAGESLIKKPIKWPEEGRRYENLNLEGFDFRGIKLKDLTLSNCLLKKCDFSDSDWEDCILINCDISETVTSGTSFNNVLFKCCQFGASISTDSIFKKCKFLNCEAIKSSWVNTRWDMCALIEVNYDDSCWDGAELNRNAAIKCSLKHATHINLNAIRASWSQCDFADGEMSGASLLNCVFHQSVPAKYWQGSTLKQVFMRGANLEGADFQGAVFNSCDLSEALLNNANLSQIHARNVQLVRAQLKGSNLSGAKIESCNLMDADLREASLIDSDLVTSWFGNAVIDESSQCEFTRKNTSCFYPKRQAA